ncbi:DnaB-like helicase C-terminal domain-containing protein [uncultured Clostridium sp.]|uniref:replicative DNA helicase n=1 Tax=uncultured Clostridium sp. TaxID=59620 RepID=UPI0026735EEC|nr:DnaB-like helicase C-terminal domain-containing protein [uncultured Clostridium sp.]
MVRQELITLEQEVLGGPIIDNSLYHHLKENVKERMFVVPEHKEIFKLVSGMFEKGMEVSVTDILVYADKNTAQMGGTSYIAEIVSSTVNNRAYPQKIKFLVDEYRKRMIKESYTRVINSNTVDEMIDITRKTLENVYKCEMPKDLDTESIYNNYLIEIENYNKSQGFKSNFYSLDEIVGKFQRGRLITVFARSGVGKSTFAIQTASNMVIQGNRVVYGSGEMSVKEVLDKISSSKLNIKHSKFTGNTLTREEKDKVNSLMVKLMENRFYITNETDINKFLNEVRLYKLKNGLDVLFVDYVNKYVTGISGITLTEKIGQVTSILKEFALKEKVCVVLLAQANRKSDGNSNLEYYEKLEVNDIQDSARIEQDSDQVIALYRNIKLDNPQIRENLNKEGKLDYNSKKAEKNPNCINLTVLKNRHGKKGTIALNWDGDYSRISNFMR